MQHQLCVGRRSKCVIFRLQGDKQLLLQDGLVFFLAGGQEERAGDGLKAALMMPGGSEYKHNCEYKSTEVYPPLPVFILNVLYSSFSMLWRTQLFYCKSIYLDIRLYFSIQAHSIV